MGLLEVRNLSLYLSGKKILDDLSMDIWEGHIHAIVGPNGAGKSSLAFCIMGLGNYQHFDGDIVFKGESIKNVPIDERAQRGITLTWQEPARYEGLKVRDFLFAGARDKSEEAIRKAMDRVGMSPDRYLNRAIDTSLSGGERKKLELASVLTMKPRLVLLDEPDSGIDVASLKQIFAAIQHLKHIGCTVILVTHSLEVLQQAEHAFLMCCGRIVDKGRVERLQVYFEKQCIPCDHKNRPEQEEIEMVEK